MSGKDTLDGTSWTLTTLNGQPALKDTTGTLNFAAGKVAGSDGCNNYSGSYTADGTNIKFSQMAATMMACPDPIMNQATAYQQALGQAVTYKANAKQLTLYDASGKELATFSAQRTGLAGTSWIVTGYNNGKQAVDSVAAGTELTANFGADGQLTGSAGRNNYTASYQTDGNNLSIGPTATTRKACEQAVMDQETQYLAALATAATYRIDGNKLELRTADGALAATFQKAAAGSDALSGSSWIVTGYNNGKQAVVSIEGTAWNLSASVFGENLVTLHSHAYAPPQGEIHPREAAQHHAQVMKEVIARALEGAPPVTGVAFSRGPGLGPCLRTTATAARALAIGLGVPLAGVNHCVAHVEIGRFATGFSDPIVLYVSGANTQVLGFLNHRYRIFGETLDIGLGNALDKFSRSRGLPHPGGPAIEALAREGEPLGLPRYESRFRY